MKPPVYTLNKHPQPLKQAQQTNKQTNKKQLTFFFYAQSSRTITSKIKQANKIRNKQKMKIKEHPKIKKNTKSVKNIFKKNPKPPVTNKEIKNTHTHTHTHTHKTKNNNKKTKNKKRKCR